MLAYPQNVKMLVFFSFCVLFPILFQTFGIFLSRVRKQIAAGQPEQEGVTLMSLTRQAFWFTGVTLNLSSPSAAAPTVLLEALPV